MQVLNVMSSGGASVLGLGYVLPVIYLIYSLKKGASRRSRIPWGAKGPDPRVADPVSAADRELHRRFRSSTDEPYEYEHVVAKEKHLV